MKRITFSEMLNSGRVRVTSITKAIGRGTGTELYKIEVGEFPGKYAIVARSAMFDEMYADLKNGVDVILDIDRSNSQPNGYSAIRF